VPNAKGGKMIDRVNSLTVILEKDVRPHEEIEDTIAAIKQLRGVLTVESNVSDLSVAVASQRVKHEVGLELIERGQRLIRGE
jgi:hypothetical protein